MYRRLPPSKCSRCVLTGLGLLATSLIMSLLRILISPRVIYDKMAPIARTRFRRQFSCSACLATVLIAVASLYTLQRFLMPTVYLWWYDQRCLREISRTTPAMQINGTTKQELVQQFIKVYGVDFETQISQHAGALAESWMNCYQINPDYCPELGAVLKWLSTAPITKANTGIDGKKQTDIHTGHSAKLQFQLDGRYKVLFKIQRYKRETIAGDMSKMKMGGERHNGEIASFHLQRLLGFNRAPIAVGRKVDISKEIIPVADDLTRKHFAVHDGHKCIKQIIIRGLTDEKRRKKRSYLCGENGVYEGVVMLWLPRPIDLQPFISPVKHESDVNFLEDGLIYPIKNNTEKLLDYVDTLLFDYLLQNGDRYTFYFDHSYYSSLLLLDNGKSFGDPFQDFKKMLDVFSGRCQIRLRTYTRLKQLSDGVLGEVLHHILSADPVAPVLWDRHYEALDRRLVDILDSISNCITTHGAEYVLKS